MTESTEIISYFHSQTFYSLLATRDPTAILVFQGISLAIYLCLPLNNPAVLRSGGFCVRSTSDIILYYQTKML